MVQRIFLSLFTLIEEEQNTDLTFLTAFLSLENFFQFLVFFWIINLEEVVLFLNHKLNNFQADLQILFALRGSESTYAGFVGLN